MTRGYFGEQRVGQLETERDELRARVAALEAQLAEVRKRTENMCDYLGIRKPLLEDWEEDERG